MARMRGLLGRSDLPQGEGILLRPAGSIHTFFMRFPIDVVFLNEEDVVVKVVHRLAPWRAAGEKGAQSVLELAAGEAESREIEVGSTLRFDPAASRTHIAFREAAQTMSEYVIVLFVISATIMAALAFMSGVVGMLIQLAADILGS
ncbi:MAG: DUF192 domain-containing protein [Actinobacteria bacterium]|nr:DUF192 domain-containing protein [Actinomycetota bacterium]